MPCSLHAGFVRFKLRVPLRNRAGKEIEVRAADWISINGYIPFQPPFYSILQEEDVARGGYLADKWKDQEVSELTIAPNGVFRASIGLDQSFSVEEVNNRRRMPSVTPGLECQRLLLGSPCNSGEDGCEPDCVAVNAFADMEWHQACLRRCWV